MAGINDLLKADATKTLAIGAGIVVLAPFVIPALAAMARPLAKAAVKSGIVIYEKGRETVAEVGEVFEDLVAEAKSEVHPQQLPQEAVEGEVAKEPGEAAEHVH